MNSFRIQCAASVAAEAGREAGLGNAAALLELLKNNREAADLLAQALTSKDVKQPAPLE